MLTALSDIDRNILWLNNHVTACRFECDLLRELGYNVFTPKYFPSNNRSFAVTREYDASLPIPAHDLELLNGHDFYAPHWPEAVQAALNRNFGTAIVACFPEMLYETIVGFRGRILLRSYGPFSETANVWRFLQETLAPGIRRRLAEVGDRFWFSEAYPNLADDEHEFLRSRRVTLPTGIAASIQMLRGTYRRSVEKVLIVLPDIAAGDGQSAAAYPQVRRHFRDIPKIIAGKQGVAMEDPDVAGMIPAGEYERLLGGAAAMFYHNVNPRHVHYHPVEAACFGMPVIFMRRGMLGVLGGADGPGACRTYEEAAAKLSRILAKDEDFIAEVVASQAPWVDYFMSASNRVAWTERFSRGIIEARPLRQDTAPKRLALIFTIHPGAFFPELVELVAASFAERRHAADGPHQIVIALASNEFSSSDLAAVESRGWRGRLFDWQTRSHEEISAALEFSGRRTRLWSGHYLVPSDPQGSLQDCDAWILVMGGEGLELPPAPLKPVIPILQGDFTKAPQRVLREILSGAKAVAVSRSLRRTSLMRMGIGHLDSFQTPRFRRRGRLPGRSAIEGDRTMMLVLPRAAATESLGRLRSLLEPRPGREIGIERFCIVKATSIAETQQPDSEDVSRFEETDAAVAELLATNLVERASPQVPRLRIETPRGVAATRAAMTECHGVWFPLGIVFDVGLLAAAAARGIPVIGPRSIRLATMANMIGLDYRPTDAETAEEAAALLHAVPHEALAEEVDLEDAVDPAAFTLTWDEVVASL